MWIGRDSWVVQETEPDTNPELLPAPKAGMKELFTHPEQEARQRPEKTDGSRA